MDAGHSEAEKTENNCKKNHSSGKFRKHIHVNYNEPLDMLRNFKIVASQLMIVASLIFS